MKTIALAGIPNCGKTTLWNNSTGKRGKTGNWCGVTTEKLSAPLKNHPDTLLVDLPGAYSLCSKNIDEAETAAFLKNQKPDCVIIVIDGMNPESSLYFALEVLSLGIPSIVAVNFADEMRRNKKILHKKMLEKELSSPVFLISGKSGENLPELFLHANEFNQNDRKIMPFSSDERHRKAESIAEKCFSAGTAKEKKHFLRAFIYCVLISVLFFSIPVLKKFTAEFFEVITAVVCSVLAHYKISELLILLIADGFISGISALVSFLPELSVIFFSIAFLEQCGFMANFAFFADGFFKKIGLSGKSAIPLLLGFGCTVTAAYTAKSTDSREMQERTLSSLMFIPCSARFPLSVLMCSSVFRNGGFMVLILLYSVVILGGFFFSFYENRRKKSSCLLEIPPFRIPSTVSILKLTYYRLKSFVSKAGAIIVLISVLIWVLKNFSPDFKAVSLSGESMLARIGEFLSPFFNPAGIPFEGVIALFCGLFSKEASLFALSALSKDISAVFSPISAVSFLLFYLLYSPCIACLFTIYKEFGIKKAAWLFLRQTAAAYFSSFTFYQLALLTENLIP